MKRKICFPVCLMMALLLPEDYADQEGKRIAKLNGNAVPVGEIDQSVQKEMKEAGITGLSMAVINHSQVVYAKAYGYKNKQKEAPMDEETVMAAASFSKPLFA